MKTTNTTLVLQEAYVSFTDPSVGDFDVGKRSLRRARDIHNEVL